MDFPAFPQPRPAQPIRGRNQQNQGRQGILGLILNYIVGGDEDQRGQSQNAQKSRYEVTGDYERWFPLEGNLLVGIVLSLWDNISGPRVERVWAKNTVPRGLLLQSAPFTLNGEMIAGNEADSKEIKRVEHKFLVLPMHFSSSLIFCARYNGQISKFALSFVFPKKILQKYLHMHSIVQDRMMQLVEVYKKVADQRSSEEALTSFNSLLSIFLENLNGLASAISSSAPSPHNSSEFFKRTIFARETIDSQLKSLLVDVITSQLQTGCTLVVGPPELKKYVQEWINTLALFLLPHQRNLARLSDVPAEISSYVPDLSLQGLLLSPGTQIKDEDIIKSTVPSTVLELQNHSVKQTHPYHEYLVIHRDFQEEERRRLAKIPRLEQSTWEAQEALFRSVESAMIINELVDKIFALPHYPPYLRAGFLSQSIGLLIRKSLVLIKYAEALMHDKKNRKDAQAENAAPGNGAGNGAHGNDPMYLRSPGRNIQGDVKASPNQPKKASQPQSPQIPHPGEGRRGDGDVEQAPPAPGAVVAEPHEMKRRIKADLGLTTESCYFVLLGVAEKLQPGTFLQVTGNPALLEERLIELFERF